MSTNLRDEINQLHANICSGLADPNRILILYTLADHPSNVTELAKSLESPQPTVSRHLKVLKERGMVKSERDGQAVIYRLVDHRIIEALDLLRAMLADSLENQAALAKTASETIT
ncbi:MAG: winged helix-turn-helix transcriptional regulator [Chloroflexi bacterium]|nr:winged helix-turn-helix transcriptional regulator [Chloroflexota bacterium]MBT3670892.1 winged helix-turn-helix transcriptional regulator [Chloroflexota bacterium]MBT4002919.1 winged helix-turn-helix transcriptional regulator [Chloroflexota bacterium]MBT4306394.1 winged helix-turn-helix transcriptional regulator [Chloroflexota bacterium]MBT4532725.1 winged helix-turn-helix transcriptional regulator [Chloroflexota bacterium]